MSDRCNVMPSATVVGARGYMGREVVRLLLNHPNIDHVQAVSGSQTGPVEDSVPGLRGHGLHFTDLDDALDTDVAFLAVPTGTATPLVQRFEDAGCRHIIDLSRDHREQAIAQDGWHYGMADVDAPATGTRRIANPGCYPTAAIVPMAPLEQAGLIGDGPIIVDGKSGISGAGVSPRQDLHFPEANETVRAYAVTGHDHQVEMSGALRSNVRFTPHLVPQTRGLFCTTYAPLTPGTEQETVDRVLAEAYADSPFVHIVDDPSTAHVRGSNRVDIAAHVRDGWITMRGAIDNLVKGGSGQAVQNMNHALGAPADAGLPVEAML